MKFIPASPLNSQSAKQQNSVARALRVVDSGQVWGWFAVAATPHGVCAATFGHDNELEAGKIVGRDNRDACRRKQRGGAHR